MSEKCVIWPIEGDPVKCAPCLVHKYEVETLGIGGEYTIKAQAFDNYLLVIEAEAMFQIRFIEDEDGNQLPIKNPQVELKEVGRRGQFIDLGGYYLNPQRIGPTFSLDIEYDQNQPLPDWFKRLFDDDDED